MNSLKKSMLLVSSAGTFSNYFFILSSSYKKIYGSKSIYLHKVTINAALHFEGHFYDENIETLSVVVQYIG